MQRVQRARGAFLLARQQAAVRAQVRALKPLRVERLSLSIHYAYRARKGHPSLRQTTRHKYLLPGRLVVVRSPPSSTLPDFASPASRQQQYLGTSH